MYRTKKTHLIFNNSANILFKVSLYFFSNCKVKAVLMRLHNSCLLGQRLIGFGSNAQIASGARFFMLTPVIKSINLAGWRNWWRLVWMEAVRRKTITLIQFGPRAPRNGKTKRECGAQLVFLSLTEWVSAKILLARVCACVRRLQNRKEKNERESTVGEWPSEPHTARTQTHRRYLLFLFSPPTHFRTEAHTLQERFFLAALLLWKICLYQPQFCRWHQRKLEVLGETRTFLWEGPEISQMCPTYLLELLVCMSFMAFLWGFWYQFLSPA